MKWTDVIQISESLSEAFPDYCEDDIKIIYFTKLQDMIMNLKGFEDVKSNCNEKILEAIQACWIDEVKK